MHAHPFETILVPVDFSEISAHALRTASLLREHCGHGSLTALYANWFEAPPYVTSGRLEELQKEFRESLAYAEGALGALPADAIREAAISQKADLIVIGTHGRSGLNRWMLGSVAELDG
ncbi:MAG: universal stress protein [Candidatus Sulfopaludibacter sp.]|nr:universal stress protein [Candidatus Sulfopaludibacter sp.]